MAPISKSSSIFDLAFSSLELDSRSFKSVSTPLHISSSSLPKRETLTSELEDNSLLFKRSFDADTPMSPIDTFKSLTARDARPTRSTNPGSGSIDPNAINMKGVQAVFALIAVSFVLGAIWFFFWAKNGGFQWRKGDWDEYKSTVLRRKGPNGTTLSNATKSTRLGGGSVVGQGYSDADESTRDGTMTELSSEAPIIKEKRNKNTKVQKGNAKDRKMREVRTEEWEGGHDQDVRAYRHEKVARVGGLNKDSEAQYYGTDYSQTDRSDLSSNVPSHQDHRRSSRQASPDKRQSRRDFANGPGNNFTSTPPPASKPARYHSPSKNPASQPRSNHSNMPGSYVEPADFSDVQSQNTKSYHHPIPNLSGHGKPNNGYRRDRRDSLDD